MFSQFLQRIREVTEGETRLRTETDIRMLNPLVLAYMGDTIYDLFVRTYLIAHYDQSVHQLHMKAIDFVRAKAQASAIQLIMNQLTEEEMWIFRRGRNAKSGTIPKNADVGDYRFATGFEALLGYLFLTGNDSRLLQIIRMTLESRAE